MSEKITFKELVDRIAEETRQSQSSASSFIYELVDLIELELRSGQPVSISGFGKFELRWMNERKGTHPRTGEEITIPGQNKVVFKPFKSLREKVNAPFAHLESELAGDKPKAEKVEVKEVAVAGRHSSADTLEDHIIEREIPSHLKKPTPAPLSPKEEESAHTQKQKTIAGATLSDLEKSPSFVDESSLRNVHERSNFNWSMAAAGVLVMLAFLLFFFISQQQDESEEISLPAERTETPIVNGQEEADEAVVLDLAPTPLPPEPIPQPVQSSSGEISTEEISTLPGESLWFLAERELGNPVLWPAIYYLNRELLDDPNALPLHSAIRIPRFSDNENLSSNERELVALGYFELYQWNLQNTPQEARYFLWVANIFSEELISRSEGQIREEDLAFALNR